MEQWNENSLTTKYFGRLTVLPKSEKDIQLQATLSSENPTGLPMEQSDGRCDC